MNIVVAHWFLCGRSDISILKHSRGPVSIFVSLNNEHITSKRYEDWQKRWEGCAVRVVQCALTDPLYARLEPPIPSQPVATQALVHEWLQSCSCYCTVYIYHVTAAGKAISWEAPNRTDGSVQHGRRYGPSITVQITPAGQLSSTLAIGSRRTLCRASSQLETLGGGGGF